MEKQKSLKIIKKRKIKKSLNGVGITDGAYSLIDNTILIKGKINHNSLKHELNHMMSSNLIKGKKGLYQLGLSYIDNTSRRYVAMDEGMTEFVAYYLNKDNPCGYKMSLFYYPFTVVMAYYSILVGVDKAIDYYMNSRIDLFIKDLKEKIDINKIEEFRKLSDNHIKNYISPFLFKYVDFLDFSLLNKEEMDFVIEIAKMENMMN